MMQYKFFTIPIMGDGASSRNFAVIVGVCKYRNNWVGALRGCVVDAQNIYTLLRENGGWDESNIRVFTDENATIENVRSAMKAVADVIRPDACHSGGLCKSGTEENSRGFMRGFQDLVAGYGATGVRSASSESIAWIAAATDEQVAMNRYDARTHGGEFTFAFCDGIRDGTCNNRKYGNTDGYASLYEAWNYAKDVASYKDDKSGTSITPVCINSEVCKQILIPIGARTASVQGRMR